MVASFGWCRQRRGNGVACPGNGRVREKGAGEVVAGENSGACPRYARCRASRRGFPLVVPAPFTREYPLASHLKSALYVLYAAGDALMPELKPK